MPEPTYEELKLECLAWHAAAAHLETVNRQLEIENVTLREQVRILAVENVKLLNKPDPSKTRQYAPEDPVSNDEPMHDHSRKRLAGPYQPLHPAAGRIG